MTAPVPRPRVVVAHLDESCLGNGREGSNPGGAAGLIETRTSRGVERRDFYVSAPATTNNRMALTSAITLLEILAGKGHRLRVLVISDSEYLVRGSREWLPGWVARGWKRKAGPIENLELWRSLHSALTLHDTQLVWVRGHAGHLKNEFVNDLAIKAAREQVATKGAIESTLPEWLAAHRAKGRYLESDPDASYAVLEQRVAAGERFAMSLDERAVSAAGGRE